MILADPETSIQMFLIGDLIGTFFISVSNVNSIT